MLFYLWFSLQQQHNILQPYVICIHLSLQEAKYSFPPIFVMKLNKQFPSVEEREMGHREVSALPRQLKEKGEPDPRNTVQNSQLFQGFFSI